MNAGNRAGRNETDFSNTLSAGRQHGTKSKNNKGNMMNQTNGWMGGWMGGGMWLWTVIGVAVVVLLVVVISKLSKK
jgi:hypothetical protein